MPEHELADPESVRVNDSHLCPFTGILSFLRLCKEALAPHYTSGIRCRGGALSMDQISTGHMRPVRIHSQAEESGMCWFGNPMSIAESLTLSRHCHRCNCHWFPQTVYPLLYPTLTAQGLIRIGWILVFRAGSAVADSPIYIPGIACCVWITSLWLHLQKTAPSTIRKS